MMIVTGASSGIGQALAAEALKGGYRVVLAARNREAMQAWAGQLGMPEHQYLIVQADVTLKADCQRLIEEAVRRFGRIDVLVNNAGISMRALFADLDLGVVERLMQVNFWGMVYCTHYALPYLLESRGSVVGVSSIAGYKGLPGRSAYSASKFAMHGFLESLRIENLNKGLHVLIACPGFTASNIRKTALAADGSQQGESPRSEERMMQADEVARHMLTAISKRTHRLVLTGQGKLTVCLNKWFPKLVDRLVFNHMAKEPGTPLV